MGVVWTFFSLIYHFSLFSPALWETARYRLKYCLKGPLNPNQPTYSNRNCRTPRHWKFTQHLRTTRPPTCPTVIQIVGRPGTGSFPSTIAPPDHPRHKSYAIWKTSFKSIMSELSVSPFEELDLLIKWLGHESKKFAMSIRFSIPTQPKEGLECILERLNERYISPELVEAALKRKSEKSRNCPTKAVKDCMIFRIL